MGWFRGGTTIGGYPVFHMGFMGLGSGLDADTVRGKVAMPIDGGTFTGAISAPGMVLTDNLILSQSNAIIELGSLTAANAPALDFHSSGNNIDYDVRIRSGGGDTTIGNGNLLVYSASMVLMAPETSSSNVINVDGTAANIDLYLNSKGIGAVLIRNLCGRDQNNGIAFRVGGGATASVNYLQACGSIAANPVQLNALGSDTNIDLQLNAKGTGVVKIGTGTVMTVDTATNVDGKFDAGAVTPTGTKRLNYSGYFYATKIYGSEWNDYAEYFEKKVETYKPEIGDIIIVDGDDTYNVSDGTPNDTRVCGIYTENAGFYVGGKGDNNDNNNYIAVSLCGRVPVKIIGAIKQGWFVTTSEIPGVGRCVEPGKHIPGSVVGKIVGKDDGLTSIRLVRVLVCNL